ncbi:MAG: cell envelope integrity protein CreD, partial [Candidatus Thiodiazotropha sp. 6PLUC5]
MNHPVLKKIMVIALLTGLLMIPLIMIEGIVYERSGYRDLARQSISASWTGEQQVLGPLLVIPYREGYTKSVWDSKNERYVIKKHTKKGNLLIAPAVLKIDGEVSSESRKRGIYSVPVYHSDVTVSGQFNFKKMEEYLKSSDHDIDWQDAYLSVVISDVRGIEDQPLLEWQGQVYTFVPDARLEEMSNGMHAPIGKIEVEKGAVDFSFNLRLNGMELLKFSPVGESTRVRLRADWPDPSFIGRYLPSSREISGEGFTAAWNLSSFSSNMPQFIESCQGGQCSGLIQDSFGVKLFNSVDVYQQSERSVKYALMFIGLTFVCFFLYEIMKGLRLHPMQYLLVGLGLSIFYLLLISLSEHMAFLYAYMIATFSSTALIG